MRTGTGINTEQKNILVTGASGQLGYELTSRLRQRHGGDHVIATDIRENHSLADSGPFEYLDVLDRKQLEDIIEKHDIGEIYHLAAILSARGEREIEATWKLNTDGLLNVLNQARIKEIKRIFWPSSIAVFGPDAPREQTPQNTPLNPNTVYGISKVAGEQWCAYYHRRFGVDVRSVRYPGLIGYKSEPGGGTTDYAVDMLRTAINGQTFVCPVGRNTRLPMMYMEDAVKASIAIMEADPNHIRIRTSYNLASISFAPHELARVIQQYTGFRNVDYAPDERDAIAASWPDSIDDHEAQRDWGWNPDYDIKEMVQTIHQAVTAADVPDK